MTAPRESPEEFIDALEALPTPIMILGYGEGAVGLSGGTVWLNRALAAVLKAERDEFGCLPLHSFWPTPPRSLQDGEEFSSEFRTVQGNEFVVKLQATNLPRGRHLVMLLRSTSAEDSTENFHVQRLETLGVLAAGVAHDFNNILAGILGHVTYLKTILPQTGPHVDSLRAIEEGGKKGSTLTGQILNFSRLDAGEVSELDLTSLVSKTCALLRGALSPDCVLNFRSEVGEVTILGVEGRIAQVVANLIINARDAVGDAGSIFVRVSIETDGEILKEAFGKTDLASSTYARVTVTDTGHGMPPEVLARVFEPYFSTKKGKGTGLGLTTVAAIVKQSGGAILISSAVGKGTEIEVFFPALTVVATADLAAAGSASSARSAPREREQLLQRGHERVLIVDDEYPVRNVLSLSLEHLGYKVETASSGAEAIAKFERARGDFALILLDMLMPQLPGNEVFFRLKRINPAVRVLLISGYSSEAAVREVLDAGGLGFLQKPFTIEELSRRVRLCIDSPELPASFR